jgi:nitroreductase
MEALEVLRNRRSVRNYKDAKVEKEKAKKILEIGTYAPTSKGSQSPKIVYVDNPETVKALDALNAKVRGFSSPYYGAPSIILVFGSRQNGLTVQDAASVLTTMLNAAYALGLGSVWVHGVKEMFAAAEGAALARKWGVSLSEYEGVGSIALGYANEKPAAAPRKPDYIIYGN